MDNILKIIDSLLQMENAVERSFKLPRELDENLRLFTLAENELPGKHSFPTLLYSLREKIMRNYVESQPKERDIHVWFRDNISYLLTGYEIVSRQNNRNHIPDFWVSKDGEYVPVEIKQKGFTSKHLEQLQRYMEYYNCEKGIAVAEELKCALPNSITFIGCNRNELVDALNKS